MAHCWVAVRVVPNKFPVLHPPEQDQPLGSDLYWSTTLPALGLHLVVIQHWRYNLCQALFSAPEASALWREHQSQLRRLSTAIDGTRYVQLIENHGPRSGGSLPHPHSQILALPIIPSDVMNRLQRAASYYERFSESVYSRIISDAKADSRVLVEDEHVIGFVPGGCERSHDVWIVPKRASSDFVSATEQEIESLAKALRTCLGLLYMERSDPDYNWLLRTAPLETSDLEDLTGRTDIDSWYRWHLEIIPHNPGAWGGVKAYGGFTMVQGTPEDMALALRQHLAPDGSVINLPTASGRELGIDPRELLASDEGGTEAAEQDMQLCGTQAENCTSK